MCVVLQTFINNQEKVREWLTAEVTIASSSVKADEVLSFSAGLKTAVSPLISSMSKAPPRDLATGRRMEDEKKTKNSFQKGMITKIYFALLVGCSLPV